MGLYGEILQSHFEDNTSPSTTLCFIRLQRSYDIVKMYVPTTQDKSLSPFSCN